MTNIFSELKNMNHQFSNALSTMLLRRLDIFLHFETYVFENPQKYTGPDFQVYQLDFLPHMDITLRPYFGVFFSIQSILASFRAF